MEDDTWLGLHRQGRIEVEGPYYLDGSAFNSGVVELRHAGWGFAVLEPPVAVTPTIASVAPPCLDASEGESFEDDLWDNQMQEEFDLDLAAATNVEGDVLVGHSRQPVLLIGHFGCIAGDHTVPHAEHMSLLRAAQHAAHFWKDAGTDLRFVSDCQLVVDSWKRGKKHCCGARHWFADIWRQVFDLLDRKFAGRWKVQKVAAHRSRAEVESGRLSHHEWLGNSKADAMARSGASKYAVAPGNVHAHVAAWDKATDLAHVLSEAGLYICSSSEWPSVSNCADADGEHEFAPVPRPRRQVTFHEIVWAVDRWRCTRCQRYARNTLTLAAIRRTACVPLSGIARGAAPPFPRVHESHRLWRSGPITWCTMCGAYSSNRSFALRQSCPGKCPSDTRLQRLRQLVLGRHPTTGIWLLEEEPQPT